MEENKLFSDKDYVMLNIMFKNFSDKAYQNYLNTAFYSNNLTQQQTLNFNQLNERLDRLHKKILDTLNQIDTGHVKKSFSIKDTPSKEHHLYSWSDLKLFKHVAEQMENEVRHLENNNVYLPYNLDANQKINLKHLVSRIDNLKKNIVSIMYLYQKK